MNNFAKKLLKGTAVVAVVGTVAAVLYQRYMDDSYEYIPDETGAAPEEPEETCEEVPMGDSTRPDDDFVSTVEEAEAPAEDDAE